MRVFDLIEVKNPDLIQIRLIGNLDSSTCNVFYEKVRAIFDQSEKSIVIDMAALQYISSAGLRSLAMLFKAVSGKKHKIFILQPQSLVKAVLTISGFVKLMPIVDDLQKVQVGYEK